MCGSEKEQTTNDLKVVVMHKDEQKKKILKNIMKMNKIVQS